MLHDCGVAIEPHEIINGSMDWIDDSNPIEHAFDVTFSDRCVSILGTNGGGMGSAEGCPFAPLSFIPGDVIGFKVGKSIKHCGIMVNSNQFIHVLRHSCVCILRIDDATWLDRLARAWRFFE